MWKRKTGDKARDGALRDLHAPNALRCGLSNPQLFHRAPRAMMVNLQPGDGTPIPGQHLGKSWRCEYNFVAMLPDIQNKVCNTASPWLVYQRMAQAARV